jgi:hypothetical protein
MLVKVICIEALFVTKTWNEGAVRFSLTLVIINLSLLRTMEGFEASTMVVAGNPDEEETTLTVISGEPLFTLPDPLSSDD